LNAPRIEAVFHTRRECPPADLIVRINEFQEALVLVVSLRCNETFDVTEQFPPRRIDFVRPVRSDDFAQRLRDDAEEGDEQFALRAGA
jgi:hypothetical protein